MDTRKMRRALPPRQLMTDRRFKQAEVEAETEVRALEVERRRQDPEWEWTSPFHRARAVRFGALRRMSEQVVQDRAKLDKS